MGSMADEITRKHGRWYVENAGRRVSGPFLTLGKLHRSVPGATRMKLGLRAPQRHGNAPGETIQWQAIAMRALGRRLSPWASSGPTNEVASNAYAAHAMRREALREAAEELETLLEVVRHDARAGGGGRRKGYTMK